MAFLGHLLSLVKDPPPKHVFEISEAGIAYSRDGQIGFEPMDLGAIEVSPVADNVKRPEIVTAALGRIAPMNGSKKPRPAGLILPDFAARVAVLDFASFPADIEEQKSLVRFRLKKSIPFDIESAAVSYAVQSGAKSAKKIEVVGVAVALEIIARYEALMRAAGFHPGMVTTSSLAMLNLYHGTGISVVVKLGGRTLAVMIVEQGALKLIRTVNLETGEDEEMLSVLQPTLAYVEDELGAKPEKLVLSGFGANPGWLATIGLPAEPLRSKLGSPGPHNAGLLGLLESME